MADLPALTINLDMDAELAAAAPKFNVKPNISSTPLNPTEGALVRSGHASAARTVPAANTSHTASAITTEAIKETTTRNHRR